MTVCPKPAERSAKNAARRRAGATNYHAGQSAEFSVIAQYTQSGHHLLHHRWRGRAGEVDLIFVRAGEVVFVEVKKSRCIDLAVAALGSRQIRRLLAAAEEFLGTQPRGALTPMRFDLAAVDVSGHVVVIENALAA
ncbi:YraN family protein [Thalassococcus lentus]|uniref:YraN family protein n=1 Tax=Thalassococcus lentus TaxID=1210524 RepID=A0ABT4XWE0_9RHOB|nr:YraN family protein [Thalassococcus lentus]MDA7426285.1 YraN family protein [Thalassococcus lentus]